MKLLRKIWRSLRRSPIHAAVYLGALAVAAYAIVGPLCAARYPMMTDLPFHAANAAILKHYGSPAWHFHEQFQLQLLEVPYLSMYLIAALCMWVLPPLAALKVSIAVMLALLPAGLAVMFWGMRKSPLLGLTGLGLAWCGLTSWGFLNFMGALGLFAMAVGLTLRLLDRPSGRLQGALTLVLLALFFTHIYRFPFALCAVIGATVVMYPATRRWRPVVLPLLGPLALFALWWYLRPTELGGDLGTLSIQPARLDHIPRFLYRSFTGRAEGDAAAEALHIGESLALGLALLALPRCRLAERPVRQRLVYLTVPALLALNLYLRLDGAVVRPLWQALAAPGILFGLLVISQELSGRRLRAWIWALGVSAVMVTLHLRYPGPTLASLAVLPALPLALQGQDHGRRLRRSAWGIGAALLVLCCAGVFLWLYLVLPEQIGLWWYVYQREITAAAFIALGLLPDLPKQCLLRAAFVAAVASAVMPQSDVVSDRYRQFDAQTRDFDAIVQHIPAAPKLLYLVFDRSSPGSINPSFIHLPAYVQATRGGWLSFHFATWGASPIVYRPYHQPGAVVPPPTPLRWEWEPQKFRVLQHGRFFDWFLIRKRQSPEPLLLADPSIRLVAHEGSWWLYRRHSSPPATP